MQVVVGRLSSPTAARTLSMDAVCTALQVLRSAKQLASYNKASGTILKSLAHDGAAAEDAQLAGPDPPLLRLLCLLRLAEAVIQLRSACSLATLCLFLGLCGAVCAA